jgi:uncharacterized protein (UPF0332 family)
LSIINPGHLLEQADSLSRKAGRKPRQADLRRAVSSTYYAVFHTVLIAASDEFVGKKLRNDRRYTLVYRSIDHAAVRKLCDEAVKQSPSAKFSTFLSNEGFEPAIRQFANLTLALQSKRHEADYDPSHRLTSVDAMFAIHQSRTAIDAFERASFDSRKLFLTLLVFPPR